MTEAEEYQSESTSPREQAPAALVHLHTVAEEMREKLEACREHGHHPKVEAVHQLRTGTRRVEATLETLAREAGTRGLGTPIEEARQRWLKQLKKVRRASGNVRDLDVHRELLAEEFLPEEDSAPDATAEDLAVATEHAGADEQATTPLVHEARLLDRWLAAQRSAAADALIGTLDGHGKRLYEAEQRFFAACETRRSLGRRAPRSAARIALEDYLRLMDAMPNLDASNLHDFRKGAKKARYVAEAGGDEPAAQAIAKAIKRVQDAIGDWHDWEVLETEAREALGADGLALQEEIDCRVRKSYDRALRLTATMGRRFVGEWQALRLQKRTRQKSKEPQPAQEKPADAKRAAPRKAAASGTGHAAKATA
jgi:CHAD domain-containing protein